MKQQYINKIKTACVKANPEIMELKFGCGIILSCDYNIGYTVRKIYNIFQDHISVTGYGVVTKEEIKEILGRPIQLADVLLAIEFRNGQTRGTKDLDMWVFQKEFTFEDKDGFQYSWDLTKPLEDQEEETLKFIAGII